jgi:hypothetical protein
MSGMSEPMDPTAATESFIDEYFDSTSAIDKRRAARSGKVCRRHIECVTTRIT